MFERTKIIHGREYRYLVRNERVGKAVRQKVVKYLGPTEPIYKRRRKKVRKSNAWLFAREPTEQEGKELNKAVSSSSAFTRDRARIILFSIGRESCKEIAEKLGCDQRKVRAAIKAFNDKGLSCLERGKAKGKPSEFTKEERAKMLKVVATDPQKLGLPFTTWSLHKLKEYFIENGIVDYISHESVRRILIKEGLRIKRSRRFQYSNDPEFDKKNST
jgi:transposase